MMIQNYDFDKLRTRFPSMTESEIKEEYATLVNKVQDVTDLLSSGKLPESDFYTFLDDALLATEYLAGYLAGKYLEQHGYIFSPDGRWFPCGM